MASLAVALDMTFANRNRGGSGVYARSLLASIEGAEGIVARVVSGPNQSDFFGTLRWLALGARRAVTAMQPDILHCPSLVAPWAIKTPVVVTVHDAGARRFPEDHPLEWRVYDRVFLPGRLRAAACVITGSEFGRREVIEAYGLDPSRVVVVPYGLDGSFLGTIPNSTTSDSGSILFPGAPVRRKNLEPILRCMAAADGASEVGRITLDISGAREEDFPRHSELVRSLGLRNRVTWLGHVPADEMPFLLGRSRAVVYPSLYEGFGFPPLEAMAVGTPVVASDRGSLPEILDNAALLIDPTDERALGEALEAVLARPELRQRLRQVGRQRARLYTWEKCAERTIGVYRDVFKSIVQPA